MCGGFGISLFVAGSMKESRMVAIYKNNFLPLPTPILHPLTNLIAGRLPFHTHRAMSQSFFRYAPEGYQVQQVAWFIHY